MEGCRKVTISGSVPPKKNARNLFVRGGRIVNVPSPRYKEWETASLWQLKGTKPVENYPVALTLVFYQKDHRKRDLDNQLSSVLDTLVKAGILKGDTWQDVCPITLDCQGVEKDNPRVEIYIDEEATL